MIKNFIILGQAIVIGILALTLIFAVHSYHRTKEDRNDWANFMISAYSECESQCNACIERFAHGYDLRKQEINYEGEPNGLDYNATK